jgi:hypothetical protein
VEGLNEHIDELLATHRPDRYDAADKSWRDPVYAAVGKLIPTREAIAVAAQQIVDQRETQATKRANRLLRKIGQDKQWPLDWMDCGDMPISVGGERICLRAAQPEDLQQWAIDERRDAAQDFAARHQACEGAEWLAGAMRVEGYQLLGDAMQAVTP